MSRARVTLGEVGENLACEELTRRGYAILARRYRRCGGEIDIVAQDGETVVFVEVKTRNGSAYGSGADAITWRKRRRLTMAASDFLLRAGLVRHPCRFDVVAVALASPDKPVIDVYPHAFDLAGAGFWH
jgi:putative endonuclease